MTSEERFAQIESILLQNTSQIALLLEGQIKTQQQLDQLANAVETNAQGIVDLHTSIEDLVQIGIQNFELAAQNGNYIRGLQVENRRILRELRDRRRDTDN